MEQQHTTSETVLLTGADYLDSIITDMESQAADMDERARQTHIPEVREGYERFADVLRHCVLTLQAKSRELRGT